MLEYLSRVGGVRSYFRQIGLNDSEIARLRVRRNVHHPRIGLRVGADGLRDRTVEG